MMTNQREKDYSRDTRIKVNIMTMTFKLIMTIYKFLVCNTLSVQWKKLTNNKLYITTNGKLY